MKKRIQKKKKKQMIERNFGKIVSHSFKEINEQSFEEEYPIFPFSKEHQEKMQELLKNYLRK